MSPERFALVQQIFQTAIPLEPIERAAHIAGACEGDEELRLFIESLISHDERDSGFITESAIKMAARQLAEERARTLIGQPIGHYRIDSLLGVGGMGEVYLAQDATLPRKAALKFLHVHLTTDPELLRRFEKEAKASSALNHPNILTVYEVGQTDGLHFIAAEYIEGQTLRQRLQNSPLSLPEAVDIACQIAAALAASHAAGIVHRDIKPENIMLRPDGIVKVLDFGLAKLIEERQGDKETRGKGEGETGRQGDKGTGNENSFSSIPLSPLPLVPLSPSPLVSLSARPLLSLPGKVMGTIGYMSPEQAQGLDVDHRADLFSLGVVLYEMAAGRTPFTGDSPHDVAQAIRAEQPPQLGEVPAGLQHIIHRALEKERAQRYQTARELLDDLRSLKREWELTANAAQTAPAKSRRAWPWLLAFVFAALLASSLFLMQRGEPPPTAPLVRPAPQPNKTVLISKGNVGNAAISPDGRHVVYSTSEVAHQGLWLRETATTNETQIVPPAGKDVYRWPAFTPDGGRIYFIKYEVARDVRVLCVVPTEGGATLKLLERIDSPVSFSPDGRRMAFVRIDRSSKEKMLLVANTDGSAIKAIVARREPLLLTAERVAWSPDGQSIVYAIGGVTLGSPDYRLAIISVTSQKERSFSGKAWEEIRHLVWLPDNSGLLLNAREKGEEPQIWQLSLDGKQARKLSDEIEGCEGISITNDANTLVTTQSDVSGSIWTTPAAKPLRSQRLLFSKADGDAGLAWMNKREILYTAETDNRIEIRVMNLNGNQNRQLTTGPRDSAPTPSPDGKYVFYSAHLPNRNPQIWRIDADGRNPQQITRTESGHNPRCSPDGRWIVYTNWSKDKRSSVWRAPASGGESIRLTEEDSANPNPAISPDGGLIAYYRRGEMVEGKRIEIITFSGGPPVKVLDVPRTAYLLRWAHDGRALIHADTRDGVANLWLLPLGGQAARPLTGFKDLSIRWFDLSPDGSNFVSARNTRSQYAILLRNFK
jgi:serine/threonine protein kinase